VSSSQPESSALSVSSTDTPFRVGKGASRGVEASPGSSVPLPSDVVSAGAQRLVAAMRFSAAVSLLYLVLYFVVWPEQARWSARGISIAMVVVSVALAAYLRRPGLRERSVAGIGIAYMAFVCLALALIDYTGALPGSRAMENVSWSCVVIVFFLTVIPAPAPQLLAGGLLAASMTPLALAAMIPVMGYEVPPAGTVLSMLLPPYLCALLGFIPARVMCQLGRELGRARRLGSYELVERLGSGGMGEVWRAHHRMLVRPAAIKLIRPEMLGGSRATGELLERFRREAQATALLESSHTVELYDFGVTDDGVLYHVMELLHGIDLHSLVRRFGPIPDERVVHILIQVCDSLDDAHRGGLVHRDVKPANLFLGRTRRHFDHVKVLDFGLVKSLAPEAGVEEIEATREGQITGTPAYMSPEMVTGESELDGRSDLYCLGCVAYWLLTGSHVFEEATPMKTAVAHAAKEPTPPSERASRPILAPLEALVMQCLAKQPDARPGSAAVMGARLADIELPSPWTERRAEEWWRENLPELAEAPDRPQPISGAGIPVRSI